jgi:DNA-3-methyladenine glycosylase I
MSTAIRRCWGTGDPLMESYHDLEWGMSVRDDRLLYEHLTLDSFQAGLSWRTILYKREAFRRAFDGFDPELIARYGRADVTRLMNDAGIIRNRQKIEAAIANAQAFLAMQQVGESFSDFLWSFTGGRTRLGKAARRWQDIPASTPESDAMAAALRQRGFRFVGTTICYAFMQAVGIVDDHMVGCFRYRPRRSSPRAPNSRGA